MPADWRFMEQETIVILLISMLAKVNWSTPRIWREKTQIRIFSLKSLFKNVTAYELSSIYFYQQVISTIFMFRRKVFDRKHSP